MEHARPPIELNMDGGPASRADAWKRWKQQFILFLKASGVHTESSSVQASLLVNLIGPEGFDIYQTFTFEKESDQDDVKILLQKFDDYFGTKPNVTLVRYKFFTRNQEEGESIQQYVTALRLMSKGCQFLTLEDDLVKDRIVYGVRNATIRDRLLRCDDLTLEKAIKICQAEELSQESGCQINGSSASVSAAHVDSVENRGRAGRGRTFGSTPRAQAGGGRAPANASRAVTSHWAPPPRPTRQAARAPNRFPACDSCGYDRCVEMQCPAQNVNCYICGNRGHFARKCKSSRSFDTNYVRGRIGRVYDIEQRAEPSSGSDECETFYVSTISDKINERSDWFQVLSCENGTENFKLDTGADVNIISYNRFLELGFSDSLLVNKIINLESYTHDSIPVKGLCYLPWSYKGKMFNLKFVVADMKCDSVLGRKSCDTLGLVKRMHSIAMSHYEDLFKGLGCLPGKYHIFIDKSVQPVVCASRKIPLALRDRLGKELSKMEQLGVIRKVNHPTSWVHALVLAAKKNNGIRICLDPRELNRAVQRAHFQLPTVTELAARLQGAQYFSVLDAYSGFWAVQLDEESADLCTFGTPFGRYQFLRLPFGINCASEVFHAKMRQLLEDLEGVDSFVDDVIVWGVNRQEHDSRLKALLDRAREINLKFNKEKCKIGVQEVTYLGHVFDKKGMRPDYSKVKAIKEMQRPSNRKDLERFLGVINYLSKFIPNYSEIAIPLTSLLKKDSYWRWEDSEQTAFDKLKECVCSAPVLALYDVSRPVVLSVDASRDALGAVLMQEGRPVEYASRTLTDAQRRYAQVEKELLAIVFACERFHQYIFGKKQIIVESDHKPLESIFKKPLMSVPARLQRMMLRIQGYDLVVGYVPGKYMNIPDTLSRAPLPDLYSEEVHKNVLYQVQMIVNNIPISNDKLTLIKKETKRDAEFITIIGYIKSGWPDHKYNLPDMIRKYWSMKDDLFVTDDVIFKDNLVLIPKALRRDMLKIIHEGHLGIDRCKRRARQVMFWPNISREIEVYVKRCQVCQECSKAPTREPLLPIEIPKLPWNKVATDIFEYKRKYFLILVDYYSNYVEVSKLNNISSNLVIQSIKEIFSRHGIPKTLISDNGTQYSSREFKKFAEEWGFTHVTSSPNYPQANGKSERAVQTVKSILIKALKSNTDFHLALLNLRNTPRVGLSSPAQLLMGRRLRCKLPVHPELLNPKPIDPSEHLLMLNNQNKSKMYYDKHCKILPSLTEGDEVVCIDGKNRSRATVIGRSNTPRSYIVQNKSGSRYRRNRRHLIKCETDNTSPQNGNEDVYSDAYDDVSDKEVSVESDNGSELYNPGSTVRTLTSPPLTRSRARKLAQQPVV